MNQTLDGTMLPATLSKSMNLSQLNKSGAVPELPAIKSPIGSSRVPAKASSTQDRREEAQAEIQAALQFGQQLENPQCTADIPQAVSDVAHNVVNSAQVFQPPPQQENQEQGQDYVQHVAHEAMARSHPNPTTLAGTASSTALAHDNLYSSVKTHLQSMILGCQQITSTRGLQQNRNAFIYNNHHPTQLYSWRNPPARA